MKCNLRLCAFHGLLFLDSMTKVGDASVKKLQDLFDFIAAAIIDFVSQEGKGFKCLALNQQRDIGFTFSFPIHQTSINEGEIVQWTKGFNIPDAVCTPFQPTRYPQPNYNTYKRVSRYCSFVL